MFGLQKSAKSSGYSGSESYKYIDRLINDEGRVLKIVTPFISSYYAKVLLGVAKKKKVYLIVSEMKRGGGGNSSFQNMAIGMLEGPARKPKIEIVAYLIILFSISTALKYYAIGIALLAMLLITTYFVFFRSPEHNPNLNLKIVRDRFIHEKLYISSKAAIVGSANLTYGGTHKNIEHIELISDRGKIAELSNHFDKMWSEY